MKAFLGVLVGALVGAPLRYHADRLLTRWSRAFPWGTLTVNVGGSFLLGLLAGHLNGTAYALVGLGFCGALTTYSTFGYETVRLAEDGAGSRAVLNVVANLLAGMSAVVLGWLAGSASFG